MGVEAGDGGDDCNDQLPDDAWPCPEQSSNIEQVVMTWEVSRSDDRKIDRDKLIQPVISSHSHGLSYSTLVFCPFC